MAVIVVSVRSDVLYRALMCCASVTLILRSQTDLPRARLAAPRWCSFSISTITRAGGQRLRGEAPACHRRPSSIDELVDLPSILHSTAWCASPLVGHRSLRLDSLQSRCLCLMGPVKLASHDATATCLSSLSIQCQQTSRSVDQTSTENVDIDPVIQTMQTIITYRVHRTDSTSGTSCNVKEGRSDASKPTSVRIMNAGPGPHRQ